MNILITTDGSDVSKQAIPHAGRLAAALDARLLLVRVLNALTDLGDVEGVGVAEAVERAAASWRADLEAMLAEAGVAGEALVARQHRTEDIHSAILRVAAERDGALIAMHARGVGAIRHALLGSVALGVLGHTPLPLLLTGAKVGQPAKAPGSYHIVVTSDGSPASAGIVPALRTILTSPGVRVTLLRICELRSGRASPQGEVEAARAQLERLRLQLPATTRSEVVVCLCTGSEDVSSAIIGAARSAGADALAMATHGHSALHHLLAGSVALGVLAESPIPLILCRSEG
jgi:nucleotide-binding universal stress UspA family protein